MSRLSDISSNPTLRTFAQGAAQSAIQPVADFLAPTVEVATSVGRYKQYTEKNRFHIPQTLRGLGGRATELAFDATDVTFNCEDCGREITFKSFWRGRVRTCPHCRAYVDVPE